MDSKVMSRKNDGPEGSKVKIRKTWGNQVESFLAHLGAIIGLGNIWRFPYILYAYGGGAFLIPYIIFALLGGFPLLFLEISMGQYTRLSAVKMWRIAPIMTGVGIGSTIIGLYCNIYYITVMAWAIFYFVHTLTSGTLPWMHCENWWNTNSCLSYENFIYNASSNMSKEAWDATVNTNVLPVIEFWNEYVLRKSDGLHDLGPFNNWQLLLCLTVSWIIVYFCIFKGVKSSGKVVYFTATFPYVVLFILLVRGLSLEGSLEGIKYYLRPNITKLTEPVIWVQACSQVCFSYLICFGALVAFGSYNKFDMNCYRHSVFLSVSCSMTSFIAGFAVFSILGNMAYVTGKNVSEVVASGPGLVFLTYPTALSLLPVPQLWNSLFFFMIILITVDSQFADMEGLMAVVYDFWKRLGRHKQRYTAVTCLIFYVIGLFFVTHAGLYIFELFNNYAASGIALLWLALMESIGVGWVYGSDRAFENVKEMIGYYPSRYIKFCWKFATPFLLAAVLLFFMVMYSPLKVGDYLYPPWANAIGWIMCMSSFLCVPGYAIYVITRQNGNLKQRIFAASAPVDEKKFNGFSTTEDSESTNLKTESL